MAKMRLNKRNVDRIETPDSGRVTYHDDQLQGFCLVVQPSGLRIWKLYRRVNGKPVRVSLGLYPEISPDAARKICLERLAAVARGEDPRAPRAASEPTLADLFRRYLEEHAKPHKKSWEDDQKNWERYLARYGTRRLSEIDRQAVRSIHLRLKDTPVSANRVLALLSKMFQFAIVDAEILNGVNPVKGIKRYRETSRSRYLTLEEIPKFWDALRAEKPLFRDFFLICLFTGARKSNVLRMRAEELNLDQQIWTIPDPKNGEPCVVHLPERAVQILRTKARSGWIFPSPGPRGSGGPLKDPKAAWNRIREKSGITDLNMHDLRRSLGSWQAAQGASMAIIGKSLGHKSLSSTEIYARLCMQPVRDSVDAALEAFNALTGEAQTESGSTPDQQCPDE